MTFFLHNHWSTLKENKKESWRKIEQVKDWTLNHIDICFTARNFNRYAIWFSLTLILLYKYLLEFLLDSSAGQQQITEYRKFSLNDDKLLKVYPRVIDRSFLWWEL